MTFNFFGIILFCLLTFFYSDLFSVTIDKLHYFSDDEHTRLVFDFDLEVPDYSEIISDTSKLKIVIEVEKTKVKSNKPIALKDKRIDSIKYNQLKDNKLQIILILQEKLPYNIFSLKPFNNRPHRLVVDVFSEIQKDFDKTDKKSGLKQKIDKKIIIIDPGHGGIDPGAIGKAGTKEKDITLSFSKILADYINSYPNLKAILTRTTDEFIPLRRRSSFAQAKGGDVFISVHCNSFPKWKKSPRGFEIYFLSLKGASDELALALANAENSADLVGGVKYVKNYELANILLDVQLNEAIEKSQILSNYLSNYLKKNPDVNFNAIKQAGFVVLKNPQMPSLLLEIGYLSDKNEELLLRKKEYQKLIAKEIANAIANYFFNPEDKNNNILWKDIAKTVHSDSDLSQSSLKISKMDTLFKNSDINLSYNHNISFEIVNIEVDSSVSNKFFYYTVKKNDTVWSISRKFGVNVTDILILNNLIDCNIKIGQQLKIPDRLNHE